MTFDSIPHPHFDLNIVVWSDSYSGTYPPPEGYDTEFDLQWRLALDGQEGYADNPGASTEHRYINDRIYEWTGRHPEGHKRFHDPSMSSTLLDRPIDPDLIRGKKCIDIGCGMGRWTRVMQALGAESVLSIDMSESAMKSVSRYNTNVIKADVMKIPEEHPEWVEKFDFACFWGVAMCTHDPRKAFLSAASTVKPGGALYLMVYGLKSMHSSSLVSTQRRRFHRLASVQDRLAYVDHVYCHSWDKEYRLRDNVRNQLIRIAGLISRRWKRSKIAYLDMLEPRYNWVIPEQVAFGWFSQAKFRSCERLFRHETKSHHLLGIR
jgi:SAM-dependent methyltransferase